MKRILVGIGLVAFGFAVAVLVIGWKNASTQTAAVEVENVASTADAAVQMTVTNEVVGSNVLRIHVAKISFAGARH